MSISLRGEAHKTEAGLQLPASSRRSGAIRWGFLALLAGVLGLVSNNQAKAQITVKALLGKAVSDPTDEQYPKVVEAITRFQNRDPKGALDALTVAKQKAPKLPPADMMLAQMWLMANQAAQARGALEECVKDNPDDPEAYLVLADLAFSERQVAAAELLFTKAEALAANFTGNAKRVADFRGRAEAGLAAVAESREQWDAAEKYLRNWLKIVDPTGVIPVAGEANTAAANAHDRLGRVLFHADTSDTKKAGARAAYEQFQQAVTDDPKSISADIALAQLYEDAKMHDLAKRFIKNAVLHPPTDPATQLATLLAAARWALDTNQANEAFDYASQALTVPIDAKLKRTLEAKFLMGVAARMKGETSTAEKALEEVVSASPGNFEASNQLAQVLAEENDPEKREKALEIASLNQAAAIANNGAQRDPRRAIEAAATLGWVFFQMDRIPEADQVTQAIINTGAASPDILYYRAKLLQESHGQTKDAVVSLRQALSNPRGFFVHRKDAEDMLAKFDKSYKPGTPVAPPATTPPDESSSSAHDSDKAPAPAPDNSKDKEKDKASK